MATDSALGVIVISLPSFVSIYPYPLQELDKIIGRADSIIQFNTSLPNKIISSVIVKHYIHLCGAISDVLFEITHEFVEINFIHLICKPLTPKIVDTVYKDCQCSCYFDQSLDVNMLQNNTDAI